MLTSLIYTVGRIVFGVGYGNGDPNMRIPGLIISDFGGLLVMRGVALLAVWKHFAAL